MNYTLTPPSFSTCVFDIYRKTIDTVANLCGVLPIKWVVEGTFEYDCKQQTNHTVSCLTRRETCLPGETSCAPYYLSLVTRKFPSGTMSRRYLWTATVYAPSAASFFPFRASSGAPWAE